MRDRSDKLIAGQEVSVVIERILPGGVGLAHAEGRTLFVALAAPGDHLRVRIDQTRGKVAFASILEIIKPSSVRVAPGCEYFGRCGGCDFQQLQYQTQLEAKVEIIRDCFRRIAHLDYPDQIPITPSPNLWQYRSRAQWKYDPIKNRLGYFERGSHSICDVVRCPILEPALQSILDSLRAEMHGGLIPPEVRDIEAVSGDAGVAIFPPLRNEKTYEVSRRIGNYEYVFGVDSFFQINFEILPAIINAATKNADGETALDLYCGVGLFTLPLSRMFSRVFGVEAHPGAVDYARRNLACANLENAVIKCVTVGDWLSEHAEPIGPIDFILLDPPRAGAEKGVVDAILAANPRRVSYVSCDPATLARDLRGLIDGGYKLDSIEAFDMFPQTHHVETVARLSGSAR